MQKILALTIATLLLAGCQARAVDREQQKRMDADVLRIMCASSDDERRNALTALTSGIAAYNSADEGDTAASAVEFALQGFDEDGCTKPAAP